MAALGGAETRFTALRIDASARAAVTALLTEQRCDILANATDPRFVMPLFEAALAAGVDYLDMAMSLSLPHPERPYEQCGVKLGDRQFERAAAWEEAGRLALVGVGVEPGLSDVFARYAADELFDEIEEIGVRDGANLTVEGYGFAPSFSIWTTIEECLNPPVVWEKDRGWFTTAPSATSCGARRVPAPASRARRTVRPATCTSTTWSTTSGRCASTARRPWSGRRRSTR